MSISRAEMLDSLPTHVEDFTIRSRRRDDLDLTAEWPDYPADYGAFNASYAQMTVEQKDKLLCLYDSDEVSHGLI